MNFAFPYNTETRPGGSSALANVQVFDIPVSVSASEQVVTVPAGFFAIKAGITNPDALTGGEALSWTDSAGRKDFASPYLQLSREVVSVHEAIAVYPETEIYFPAGAQGVVSVVGNLGLSEPTLSTIATS